MLQIKTNKIIKSAHKKMYKPTFGFNNFAKQNKCKVSERGMLLLLHSSRLLKIKHYKNPLNGIFSALPFRTCRLSRPLYAEGSFLFQN